MKTYETTLGTLSQTIDTAITDLFGKGKYIYTLRIKEQLYTFSANSDLSAKRKASQIANGISASRYFYFAYLTCGNKEVGAYSPIFYRWV